MFFMDFPYFYLIPLVFWLILLTLFLIRLSVHYQNLTKGISKKNLISSLNQLIAQSKANQDDIKAVEKKLNKEIKENKLHLQNVGFVRFNPFTNTGGNQSFALALLDEKGTGIVINSLHSRETTRLYAKKIIKQKSVGVSLSTEEKEAIKQALE